MLSWGCDSKNQKSDEERLAVLERKKAALDARRQALRARISKKVRAIDTRRKILVGSLLLSRISAGTEEADRLEKWLQRELPGFLTRQIDRELFTDILGQIETTGTEETKDGPLERQRPTPLQSDLPNPETLTMGANHGTE